MGGKDLEDVKEELERVKAELAAAKLAQSAPKSVSSREDDNSETERRALEEESRRAKEELERVRRAAAEEAEKSRAELERLQDEIEEAKRRHAQQFDLLMTSPSNQPATPTTSNENAKRISEDEAKLMEDMKRTKEQHEKAQAEALALKQELEEARLSFLMEIKTARRESATLRHKLREMNLDEASMKDDATTHSEAEVRNFKEEIDRLQRELREKERESQRMENIILDMTCGSVDSEDSIETRLSGTVEENDNQIWQTVDHIKSFEPLSDGDELSETVALSMSADPSSSTQGMSICIDHSNESVGSITVDSMAGFMELKRELEVLKSELRQKENSTHDVRLIAEDSRRNMEELRSLRDELMEMKMGSDVRQDLDTQRLETVSEGNSLGSLPRDGKDFVEKSSERTSIELQKKPKKRAPRMTCFWAPFIRSWMNDSSMSKARPRGAHFR
uniref:Uncharacterized protein n=1 Tax=Ditylum brightwellii TaxID=49249 RepID=A0A7S4S871_9STRA